MLYNHYYVEGHAARLTEARDASAEITGLERLKKS
jgi:hypothetical protein